MRRPSARSSRTRLRIAAPIVVPRPVVRVSTACRTASRSVVGETATWANPENSTRPMRVSSSCSVTNFRTASWAAPSRLGSTSVAHIEPETSTAMITAPLRTGTSASTCGRAAARPSSDRAASTSAKGACRRQRGECGAAARTRATLEWRTASRRRRLSCQRYAVASAGTRRRRARAQGQARDMARPPAPTWPGRAGQRRGPAPRLLPRTAL